MNGQCERCNTKTNVTIGSYFNTQMICVECMEKEIKHEKYDEARRVESEQVKNGNYNYPGIGLPNDLQAEMHMEFN